MKTILQINTNVGWNSTGRIAEDLGRMAIDAGWESYIAYGRRMKGEPQSVSRLIKIGGRNHVNLHALSTRVFDNHGLCSHRETLDFVRQIDELRPDIVHLHNIHGYYLNYEVLFDYLARTGLPVVWTLHDCWPFTGHCAYFDSANCSRWQTGCFDCPLKAQYPASRVFDRSRQNYIDKLRAFTRLSDLHIVGVSQWVKDTVAQSFLKDYPAYVIRNGIEPRPLDDVAREPKLLLGCASVWDERKGLKSFFELRRMLPADYRIVLIGLTPSQIRNLPAGIEGHQRISDRASLRQWFQRAAVFVNPSVSENLPVTNLEVQDCGTPVVCYDSGGMRETVSPRSGIVVPQGDIDALAAAIRRVTLSPESFSAEDCRRNVRENFDSAVNYRAYIQLYESLVDRQPVKIEDYMLR